MENACEADFTCVRCERTLEARVKELIKNLETSGAFRYRIIAYRVRIFNGKFRGQKPIV